LLALVNFRQQDNFKLGSTMVVGLVSCRHALSRSPDEQSPMMNDILKQLFGR